MERKNLEKEAKETYREYVRTLNKAFQATGVEENEYFKASKKLSDRKLYEWMRQIRENTIALKKGLKRLHK